MLGASCTLSLVWDYEYEAFLFQCVSSQNYPSLKTRVIRIPWDDRNSEVFCKLKEVLGCGGCTTKVFTKIAYYFLYFVFFEQCVDNLSIRLMILLKDIFSVKVFLIPVSHIDDGRHIVLQKRLAKVLQDDWKYWILFWFYWRIFPALIEWSITFHIKDFQLK